jgi:16S rRNA (guanine527-N7)-methyltransferase
MDKSFIKTSMSQLNITLSDEQIDMFNTYYELLVDWNSRMNLTAITEYEDVIIKHFVDSLSIVKYLDLISVSSDKYDTYSPTIIDIGTGAGFPGIPIKILLPSSKVVLVDSLNKRINFLNEVIKVLDLKDITAIHSRAEDFGHGVYREKGDYVVSRAVANISTLSEYCLPLVKTGGVFISYKSEKLDEELSMYPNAINTLGGKIKNNISFTIGDDISRNLLVVEKVNSTKGKYPRKSGLPSKEPLH